MSRLSAETFLRLARQPRVWTWFALITEPDADHEANR